MKHFLMLVMLAFAGLISAQNSGWEAINHLQFQNIEYAHFYNDQLGMAVEEDKYHITKDGGKTWKTTYQPGLYGQKCKVFIKQTDTLFIISSSYLGMVLYSYGINHPLDTLDYKPPCYLGNHITSGITGLDKGSVIYVSGCHPDSGTLAPTILVTYDVGRTWKKHVFTDMAKEYILADIIHRNADTLILRWHKDGIFSANDFSEFRVDTFATRVTARANTDPVTSITCEGFQCLYNHYLYYKGNQFFSKLKSPLKVHDYGASNIGVSEFFDRDEFLILPEFRISNSTTSRVYAYHIANDSIDETAYYDIGPDISVIYWRNISVTDYSVFIVSNSKIFKNSKEKIGLREDVVNNLSGLKIYQSPGFVSVTGLEQSQLYGFKLYSSSGTILSSGSLDRVDNSISTSKASKGIYMLSIENASGKEAVFKVLL